MDAGADRFSARLFLLPRGWSQYLRRLRFDKLTTHVHLLEPFVFLYCPDYSGQCPLWLGRPFCQTGSMKTRLLHALLALALLLPMGITAVAAQTTDCPITPGKYDGVMDATLSYSASSESSDVTHNTTIEFSSSGELHFTISCQHVTGTVIRHTDFVGLGEATGGDVTVDTFDSGGSCTQVGQISAGEVVQQSNGHVELHVRIDVVEIQGECIGGGPDGPGLVGPAAATTIFIVTTAQGGQIAGNWRVEYDNGLTSESLLQTMANSGTIHIDSRTWSLTKQPKPSVTSIRSTYRQFFLQGIPLKNEYVAVINWDEGQPKEVTFTLDGQEQNGHLSADEETATAEFDLGTLPVSGLDGYPLQVVAKPQFGEASDTAVTDQHIYIVPLPRWAAPLHFQAESNGDHVIYRGHLDLPEKAIEIPPVTIPNVVPYIGGSWGLTPTQLKITVPATSAGGQPYSDPGPEISTTGQLLLGNLRDSPFNLRANGHLTTTLQADGLTLAGSNYTLSLAHLHLEDSVGLGQLLPGVNTLSRTEIPVVSALLRSVNNLANLKGHVDADLTGHGEISSDDEKIFLAKAAVKATVTVTAQANLNLLQVVAGNVTTNAAGSLDIELWPGQRISGCSLTLGFRTSLVALGKQLYQPVDEKFPVPLPGCSAAATGVNKPLALTRLAPSPRLSGGHTLTLQPEQTVFHMSQVNDLPESTLVQNGSWLAAPALAVAPNGAQALAWNSGVPGAIPDQVKVRWATADGWSEPLTLSTQPAFAPVTAFDGRSQLLVLWTEAHTADDNLSPAYVQGMEIGWALVDVGDGRVSQQGTLTNNNLFDFGPKLVPAPDSSVWAVWQHSPGSQLVGTAESPNALHAARWDGAGWSDVETVTGELVGTLAWQAAAGSNLWLVADGDMDGDLTTPEDRELFAYTRSGGRWTAAQLTHNDVPDTAPLLAAAPDGQPALAWIQGDAVVGVRGNLTAQPSTWLGQEVQVTTLLSNGRLLAGEDGEMQLLWPEVSAQGQDILQSRRDPATGAWSNPAPLFNTAEKRASLAAALAANGDLLLAMTRTDVIHEPATLDNGQTVEFATSSEQADVVLTTLPDAFSPITSQSGATNLPVSANDRIPWLWLGLGGGFILVVGVAVWLRRRKT